MRWAEATKKPPLRSTLSIDCFLVFFEGFYFWFRAKAWDNLFYDCIYGWFAVIIHLVWLPMVYTPSEIQSEYTNGLCTRCSIWNPPCKCRRWTEMISIGTNSITDLMKGGPGLDVPGLSSNSIFKYTCFCKYMLININTYAALSKYHHPLYHRNADVHTGPSSASYQPLSYLKNLLNSLQGKSNLRQMQIEKRKTSLRSGDEPQSNRNM